MDRYYTPELREFRVGFQCEQFDESTSNWNEYIVTEKSWSSNGMFKLLRDEPNSFRTKYLDRTDIESLGWVYHSEDEFHIFYLKDNHRLCHSKIYQKVLIEMYDDKQERIIDKRFGILFNGEIKNISELRILLKWLNIE